MAILSFQNRLCCHSGASVARPSTIGPAPVKDTTFVLALFGAFLTLSGAASNWWAARFASNYRGSYRTLFLAFAAATVVLIGVAVWAKFSKPRGGSSHR